MHQDSFSDAALVLFGHGSTLDPDSGSAIFQHASELRRRALFAEVREAFWKQDPRLQEVAAQLTHSRVFFVPFFLSEGYFSGRIIPTALGFDTTQSPKGRRARRHGGQTWIYCEPVGTHPGMTRVVLDLAHATLRGPSGAALADPAQTSLFIAAHGTTEAPESRAAAERQADSIRRMSLYASVHPVYLEEEPRVDGCYQLAPVRNLVVVPFFAGDGPHVRQDIPVLLGESKLVIGERLRSGMPTWVNPTEKRGKLVWCTPSVGTDPALADIVLHRVREAAKGTLPNRVDSRIKVTRGGGPSGLR